MRGLAGALLVFLLAAGVGAQEAPPPASDDASAVPAPDEVIVFENKDFGGASLRVKAGEEISDLRKSAGGNWELRISSVKVGDEAVVALFSSFGFKRYCLGLPGRSFGGRQDYRDLAKVKNKSLRTTLENKVRSLRVLGKDADLKNVCH